MAEPARATGPASRPGDVSDHGRRAVVRPISRGAARGCSRPGCPTSATATLSFDYATRQAALDALAADPDPSTYDLCRVHADRTRPPHGWGIDDRRPDEPDHDLPTPDDLASPSTVAKLAAALGRGSTPSPAPEPEVTEPGVTEPEVTDEVVEDTVQDQVLAEFGQLGAEPATDPEPGTSRSWGVEEAWRARRAEGRDPGAPRTVPGARRD